MEQNPFSKFYLSAYVRQKRESSGLSTLFISESLKLDHDQYLQMENGDLDFTLEALEELSSSLKLQDQDINDLLQFANISQVNALAAEFYEDEDSP